MKIIEMSKKKKLEFIKYARMRLFKDNFMIKRKNPFLCSMFASWHKDKYDYCPSDIDYVEILFPEFCQLLTNNGVDIMNDDCAVLNSENYSFNKRRAIFLKDLKKKIK